MKRKLLICTAGAAAWISLASSPVAAGQDDNAERSCKSKIEDVYGVNEFRNIWTETLGNHKFRVHGQVKTHDHKYEFNCKVKNGHVQSYAYDGPHKRQHDGHDNDNDNVGAVVAVGAGLAVLAAVVASRADDDDNQRKTSALPVSQTVLEDECHDMLQYRIRDEHDYTARVHFNKVRLQGHDLVGDARVKYDRDHPHHARFACHFDDRGRLMDSRYSLY